MTDYGLTTLLSLPLRMHGIQLGRLADALLDRHADRVLGFEVVCGDGTHRFLPFSVARIGAGEIVIDSALTLVDEGDLDFYRRHCRRLADAGFVDPWVDAEGNLHEAQSAA